MALQTIFGVTFPANLPARVCAVRPIRQEQPLHPTLATATVFVFHLTTTGSGGNFAPTRHGKIPLASACVLMEKVRSSRYAVSFLQVLIHVFFADTCIRDPDFSSQNADMSAPLTTCGDKSLCCGNIDYSSGQQCCTRRGGFFIENGKLVAAISASAAASSASSSTTKSSQPTSSSNFSPETSSPTSQLKSTSTDTGAIVGGVVGGIACIVFLALAFWYFMIRRAIRHRPPPQSYEPYQTAKQQDRQDPSEAPTYASGSNRGELDGAVTTQELEGWQKNTS